MNTINTDQSLAVETILNGHNLILTGQAGTGKTYTIQNTCKELEKRNISCALTCSTGIATCAYCDVKAWTLHKWCGILDGQYFNEELLQLIKDDERYIDTKNRICETQCLFIDEVSMINSS